MSFTDDEKSRGEQIAMSLERAQRAEEEIDDTSKFVVCVLARDEISSNRETNGPDRIGSEALTDERNCARQWPTRDNRARHCLCLIFMIGTSCSPSLEIAY